MVDVEDPGLCAGFVLAALGISASLSEENMCSPYEGDFFFPAVLYFTKLVM